LKTTQYFEFRRSLPDRVGIQDKWIEQVVRYPAKTQTQLDGRIRKWAKIEQAGGRFLRVVLLDDGETIHNAFFDRSFEE